MKRFFTTLLVVLSLTSLQAQLTDWEFRRELTIANTSNTNDFNGGPIHFVLNGQTLVNDGKIESDFSDLRISIDCDGDSILNHWIENPGNTSDSVVVWIRYPDTILAAGDVNLFAFYGNPTAGNVEDFDIIFPNRVVLSADSTFGDTIVTDWFEIPAGLTLSGETQSGVHMIIASRIKVDGTINLDGLGELQDLAAPAAGAGTGADGFGGGGGGHGGNGGAGSNDGTGTGPGAGGSATGNATNFNISMGFAGGFGFTGSAPGTAPSAMGGNGGGSIKIDGQIVTINDILSRGLVGEVATPTGASVTLNGDPSTSAAGGGAGGGLNIQSSLVAITGAVNVRGGTGGNNPGYDEGAGGGGAGGRVKVFAPYRDLNVNVAGGNGGVSVTTPGTQGGMGTLHEADITDKAATRYAYGPETPTTIPFTDAEAPNYEACRYDSIGFTVADGFDNYEFFLGGTSVQNGPLTSVGTDTLSFDREIYVLGTSGVCITSSDTLVASILARPFADFDASGFNLTWTFTDASTNATEWAWDFGDGTGTSTDQNPVYDYSSPGNYTVCLTAINNAFGCPTFDTCMAITVECNPPLPGFTFTQNGLQVNFSELADFETDYFWEFGDGETSTDPFPNHTYNAPGTYTVTQTVSSVCGTASTTTDVTVDCNYETTFDVNQFPNSLTVEFTNTTPANQTSRWDFGDGLTTAGPAPVTHTFAQPGAYTVCLTSESNCGATVACKLVSVTCNRPSVDYSFSVVDTTVTFTAAVSGNIGDVTWDFGDDSTTTALNPVYTYAKQGTYNVCLEAENECGLDGECKRIVADCPNPQGRFEFVKTDFTVAFGDSSANASKWLWTLGDGTTSTAQHPVHTYRDDTTRTYFVCLYATNSCNETSEVCKSFKIIKKQDPVGIYTYTNADVQVFPNPVTETLYVNTPARIIGYTVVAFNGAVVLKEQDFSSQGIAVAPLQSGSYIIVLTTDTGAILRKRFVKQ